MKNFKRGLGLVLIMIVFVVYFSLFVQGQVCKGDEWGSKTCTASKCEVFVALDKPERPGTGPIGVGTATSGGINAAPTAVCTTSCIKDGQLVDECALYGETGDYYMVYMDDDSYAGTDVNNCGDCKELDEKCGGEYKSLFCKIPDGTYSPEDYSNKCAAAVDSNGDGNADDDLSVMGNVWLSAAAGYKCCGNKQDAQSDNGNIYHTNDKMCTHKTDGKNGPWKWLGASEVGVPFKVYTINRGSNATQYTAVSNTNDWYICSTKDGAGLASLGSNEKKLTNLDILPLPATALGTVSSGTGGGTGSIGGSTNIDDFNPVNPNQPQDPSYLDADGDGFTTDPALEFPDCDDNNPLVHPGAYDPCTGMDLGCDDLTNGQPCLDASCNVMCDPVITEINTDRARAARFVCYNEDNRGAIAECCNGVSCNNDVPIARTVGGVLTSLKEYYEGCDITDNCLFSWQVPKSWGEPFYHHEVFTDHSVPVANKITLSDVEVTDWSDYDYLEFYIYMTNSFIGELRVLGPRVNQGAGDGTSLPDYSVLETKTLHIKDYVVNTPVLNQWMHVKLPLSLLANKNEVNGFVFYADKDDVEEFGKKFNYNGEQMYNVVGIDRIFLSKTGQNRFCSASFFDDPDLMNLWISDLDSSSNGADSQEAGRYACDATPGYGWTGNNCCGDDTDADSQEFFADTFAGCAAGSVIHGNERAGFIEYATTVNGIQKLERRLCRSTSCEYPLSGGDARLVTVTNAYPLKFDLRFVENNSMNSSILIGAETPDYKIATLRAENIPRQLLYYDQKFHGCNAETFNSQGIPPGDLDEKQECNVVGNFFCSMPQGRIKASFWSDEGTAEAASYERNTSYALPGDFSEYSEFFNTSSVNFGAQGCCSPSTCWNGVTCVKGLSENLPLDGTGPGTAFGQNPNSFTKPFGFSKDGFDQYVCISTEESTNWTETYYKEKFDNSSQGYCISEDSCWSGSSCATTGYAEGDNYCQGGNWTSRTKFLGEKFLKLVEGKENFVFYCDNYTNTLNHYNYPVAFSFLEGSLVEAAGANNFCMVKYNDDGDNGREKVVIGTSLNKPVKDRLQEFLDILEVDNCRDAQDIDDNDGLFHQCKTGDNHLWYNNKSGLIVYTKDGDGVRNFGTLDGKGKFLDFIHYPIEAIIDLLVNIIKPATFEDDVSIESVKQDFFDGLGDFSRVYLARNESKTVLGVHEELSQSDEFLTLKYMGFSADLCKKVTNPYVTCQPVFYPGEDKPRYIMTSFVDLGLGVWRDVASKLRLHQVNLEHIEPVAVILEPAEVDFSDSLLTTTSTIDLRAQVDDSVQSYYWDIESGDILNGQYGGDQVVDVHFTGRTAGFHNISLMTLAHDGTYKVATRTICINDMEDPMPDIDGDGILNGCDSDDDGDFVLDSGDGDFEDGNNPCTSQNAADCDDNCPTVSNPDQLNSDEALEIEKGLPLLGDACDEDTDGDGVPNVMDAFPDDKEVSSDFDGDGLADEFNPGVVNANAKSWSDCDEAGIHPHKCLDQDDDNDGLPDIKEDAGCRFVRDCDGDGLLDNEKLVDIENGLFGSSPLHRDTDGDGLTDCQEVKETDVNKCENSDYTGPYDGGYHTNPTLADSDNDFYKGLMLTDYNETIHLGSNASSRDTDLDGMHDGWEVYYDFLLKVPSDSAGDADNDGLTNLQEFIIGSHPRNDDTDNDGYKDGEEVLGPDGLPDTGDETNPLIQDATKVTAVFPEQGAVLAEITQFIVSTDKKAQCRYSENNIEYSDMNRWFTASTNGLEHRAVANVKPNLNTIFVKCKDLEHQNIIMKDPYVMQFTYDSVIISITSTNPKGRIFTLTPNFAARTTREAACKYSDSENFVYADGSDFTTTNSEKTEHTQANVDILSEVNEQITICENSLFKLPLLFCEAKASGDLTICNSPVIAADGSKEACEDEVHFVAAIKSVDVNRCNQISDPEDKADCLTLVNTPQSSYPLDGSSCLSEDTESEIENCQRNIRVINALRLGDINQCVDGQKPECKALLDGKKNLCVNAVCTGVFDHLYTYGVLCKDEYDRISPPGAINFRLRNDLEIP